MLENWLVAQLIVAVLAGSVQMYLSASSLGINFLNRDAPVAAAGVPAGIIGQARIA